MLFLICRYCQERKALRLLLHVNFITPLILVLLWIRPLSRDILTVKVFSGMPTPLYVFIFLLKNVVYNVPFAVQIQIYAFRMSVRSFESLRLILIVISMLLRICVMPIYLQAYLNMAYDRTRALKNEVGKISNIDLQKNVSI